MWRAFYVLPIRSTAGFVLGSPLAEDLRGGEEWIKCRRESLPSRCVRRRFLKLLLHPIPICCFCCRFCLCLPHRRADTPACRDVERGLPPRWHSTPTHDRADGSSHRALVLAPTELRRLDHEAIGRF